MSNEPVAWMRPDNRVREESTAGTQFSRGPNRPPIGTWIPLYTHPAPDDTALLRQALEALEQVASAMPFPVARATITALRERLGEKT